MILTYKYFHEIEKTMEVLGLVYGDAARSA